MNKWGVLAIAIVMFSVGLWTNQIWNHSEPVNTKQLLEDPTVVSSMLDVTTDEVPLIQPISDQVVKIQLGDQEYLIVVSEKEKNHFNYEVYKATQQVQQFK